MQAALPRLLTCWRLLLAVFGCGELRPSVVTSAINHWRHYLPCSTALQPHTPYYIYAAAQIQAMQHNMDTTLRFEVEALRASKHSWMLALCCCGGPWGQSVAGVDQQLEGHRVEDAQPLPQTAQQQGSSGHAGTTLCGMARLAAGAPYHVTTADL